MFRARYVMLVALLTLIAIGTLFGQARDFEPPSPAERLEELTGYRPEVRNEEYRVYQPRRFRNPLMDEELSQEEGFLGRSPFVVYEMEERRGLGFWQDSDTRMSIELPRYAGQDAYEPVLNLSQYSVSFDFETPRYLTMRQPDGSARNYWYMLFTAANYEPYPKDVSLDFKIKTMAQDIYPEPEMAEPYREQLDEQLLAQFARFSFYGPEITQEQIQQMNEMLLARFSGYGPDELERMPESQRRDILERIRSEMLRGIRRSLAINYLNYPDRILLDRIADREARWRMDENHRRYNPLVPAHHLALRRKLLPRDDTEHIGYAYPDIVLEDVASGDGYVISPIYQGPGEEPRFEVKIAPANGDRPVVREFASLEAIDNAGLGDNGMIRLSPEVALDPEEGMVEYIEVPFGHAVRRYWPRYQIGQRVDQYGFQLPPGHPEYERGIHLRSYHTIMKLHGARYADLEMRGDRVVEDGELEGMISEEGVLRVPETGLPEINGKRLIGAPADQMLPILNTFYQLRDLAPNLYDRIRNDVEFVLDQVDREGEVDEEVIGPRIRSVVTRLLDVYANERERDEIPHAVIHDLEQIVLRNSRLAFMEADNEETRILGDEHGGYLWDAQFFPAICYVKRPTPRRYAPEQHVLRNYRLPTEPAWSMPEELDWGQYLYRDIGEEEAHHSYTVSGVILEPHEFSPGAPSLDRSPPATNRYGERAPGGPESTYEGALVEVREGMEPFYDTDWGRDEQGHARPVKRVDSYGRTMHSGLRVYRVGDRVTPMEWEAYGSLLPVSLLRNWAETGGYNPEREYLQSGDLLVGQPRLVLAEFRYESEQMPSGDISLWPRGDQVEGEQEIYLDERTGTYWRHGFRLDAAGDYDAIVYEELGRRGQNRFDELLENTLRKPDMDEASTRAERGFLKLVPKMDRYGAPLDYVHPVTGEKIPQRVDVLPSGDQLGEVKRDNAGNTVFATAYKKLPRYLYEYEYQSISESEAQEIEPERFDFNQRDPLFRQDDFMRDRTRGISEREIDRYWNEPQAERGSMSRLVGQPKVMSVPTLEPAKINENFEPDEYITIDRMHVERIIPAQSQREVEMMGEEEMLQVDPMHEYDRIYLTDLSLVHRVSSLEPLEQERDPSISGRNAVLYGTIIDDAMPDHILFRVQREVIPTVAEGVAIFGEFDRQWDFMNVYVYGIKGPFRRSGMETLTYASETATGRRVTRHDHAPRLERENWVLQLRFERLGSPLTRESQSVRFIRRYWYRDMMDTRPEDLVQPVRD